MQTVEKVTIRKAPKFLSFFLLGAGIGVLAGFIAWLISLQAAPADGTVIVGYLVVVLGVLGAGLGVVSALVLDGISRSRSRTLEATKLVESAPKRRSKPAPKK
jgi:hypothetical protein